MSPVADALDEVVDVITDPEPVVERPKPYVTAIPASQLFSDGSYQRPVDDYRVSQMVDDYDETLLGVLEVSARDDGRFAVVDGGHRWAAARQARGQGVHLVCNVHRGLSVTEEARLFYEIDSRRRALTGWDRWWARRGAGDPKVLEIEKVVTSHGLRIAPDSVGKTVRATKACEKIVAEGGVSLLDVTLSTVIRAFGPTVDAFDGAVLHGVALVVHHYIGDMDPDRLVGCLQEIPPRQLKARALLLREVQRGTDARLVASVVIERYNAAKGPKVPPFTERVPPSTKAESHPQARYNAAVRSWARRNNIPVGKKGYISRSVKEQYARATGGG